MGTKLALWQLPQHIDHIGLEVAYGPSPEAVAEMFQRANDHIGSWPRSGRGDTSWVGNNIEMILSGIAAAFLERGLRPPQFFPIDVYDRPGLQQPPQAPDIANTLREPEEANILAQQRRYDARYTGWMGERESRVLQQLHAHAQEIGADGQTHVIASIQGVGHELTPVAARLLGWPVSMTHASPPLISPGSRLRHLLRLHPEAASDTAQMNRYFAVQNLARMLFSGSGLRQRLEEEIGSEYLYSIVGVYALAKIGMACLRGYAGTLPTDRQLIFNQLTAQLEDQQQLVKGLAVSFLGPLISPEGMRQLRDTAKICTL